MSSEQQQWDNIRDSYLKMIQKDLAQVDHPRRTDILNNVREHLENKYAELSSDQHNWESYQQIITEMGPPEEYAELLTENNLSTVKSTPGTNKFLSILFVVVLAAVGGYLVYTAMKVPSVPSPASPNNVEFEPVEHILGKWITVDFVRNVNDFWPDQKNWRGEFFLKELTFEDNGILWWSTIDGGPYKHCWTKGKLDPFDKRAGSYQLRVKSGNEYLFVEWINSDVIVLGEDPSYYVLKKERVIGEVPVIIADNLPINGIIIGNADCTLDTVKSLIESSPDIGANQNKNRLGTKHGITFRFSDDDILINIYLHNNFKGMLNTGISIGSSTQNVFDIYGHPTETVTDRSKSYRYKRILYRGREDRISYADCGIEFWFKDDKVDFIILSEGKITNLAINESKED